jgi:CubicO group peptidase (beta-lactamase class C family)
MIATDSLDEELRRHAASFLAEHRLVGASVGVVRGGELAWCDGLGWCDLESGGRPDEHTLYRIASITKTFTATAIVQLRDEGRVRLDDPAVRHVDELRRARSPFGPIEEVTLRRLLMHESGLMSEAPGMDVEGNLFPTTDEVLAEAERIRVTIPPGSAHKYSNLGFQLLGEVVARVAATPYTRYVTERILEPLEMARTTFEPHGPGAGNIARGYNTREFSDFVTPAARLSPSGLEADGGLWSTVADLARWISFWCGPDEGGRHDTLASTSRAEMLAPRALASDDWSLGQGLGWYTARRDGVALAGHEGQLDGFTTAVMFAPEHRAGAVALVNGIAPAGDLAFDLAARALPEVPEPSLGEAPPAPVPAEVEPLLGLFVLAKYGASVRVEWRGGRVVLFVDGEERGLEATDDALAFHATGGREAGEEVVFERTPAGAVDRVNVAGYPFARVR